MYLIVGLGNPTDKYEGTRHNAGFEAIDFIAKKHNINVVHNEHKGITGKGLINGTKVMLVKPQTYMNLSGECVIELCKYYGVEPEEVLVISDDVTLDCGKIRVRKKGSAGGHNGLKDIIAWLDTQEFPRVRVGVGKLPEHGDMVAHVLGRYNEEDRKLVNEAIEKAAQAVEYIISGDIEEAMNKFN